MLGQVRLKDIISKIDTPGSYKDAKKIFFKFNGVLNVMCQVITHPIQFIFRII